MSDNKTDQERFNICFEAIQAGCLFLNSWESDFFDDIGKKLSEGKSLSWKQVKCLIKIYEKIE